MSKKIHRAINFDLSVKLLIEHYHPIKYLKAYNDISKFMKRNGFEHRQWSGYRTKEPIGDETVVALMTKMKKELPWIDKCSTRIDVTNIGKIYDIKKLYKSGDEDRNNSKEISLSEVETSYENTKQNVSYTSFEKAIQKAKEDAAKYNERKLKNQNINKNIELGR